MKERRNNYMCFFGKRVGGGKKQRSYFISDFWVKGEKKDFILFFGQISKNE